MQTNDYLLLITMLQDEIKKKDQIIKKMEMELKSTKIKLQETKKN